MKYAIVAICSILIFGCAKEPLDSVGEKKGTTSIAHLLFADLLDDYNNDLNAVVNITVTHFFQSEFSSSNSVIRVQSVFGTDEYDETVGIVNLDPFGESVIDSDKINTFSDAFACCDDMPATRDYKLSFESDNNSFESFEEDINIDFGHIVNSNLGFDSATSSFVLDTSIDFDLSWTDSIEDEDIYIYLCTADTDCIKKKTEDTGALIIDKEEMAEFPSGQSLSIYLLKIKQYCIDSNDKDVCINSITYSRPGIAIIK